MKNIDEMTEEEIRRLLEADEKRKARLRAWHAAHGKPTFLERIARDPKAYFTRRKDFEDAEKRGIDTSSVPKLNVIDGAWRAKPVIKKKEDK